MASEVLQSISRDEHERAMFHNRLMYKMDMQSNLVTMVQRGRTEGRVDLIIFAVRRALKEGMPIADIADNTGLTCTEIKNIVSVR